MRYANVCITLWCGLWICCTGCKPPADPLVADSGPAETERVKAEAGVGKQGQLIGDQEGFLLTPAKVYFSVKQRVVFEIQIPQALNLYQAEHESYPQTHEEFMSKIIEPNNIVLPQLPEGQNYVWDGEAGELMVEKPKE